MGKTNNVFACFVFFFFFFFPFFFLKNADTHQLNQLQFYFGYQKIKRSCKEESSALHWSQ